MYVWELVSCRLHGSGWDVWHSSETLGPEDGPVYRVHLRRPGVSLVVDGPTLTEAYASAARQAREHGEAPLEPAQGVFTPHFGRAWTSTRP